METVCNYCYKEFSCKLSLTRHQKTTKSCLEIQGKTKKEIECQICNKKFAIEYYKQHKIKCDISNDKIKKYEELYLNELKENQILKTISEKLRLELEEFKTKFLNLEKQNEVLYSINNILKEQNEKLQSSSTSISMKLAEKTNTVNTVVINTSQLTNDVLRQCANTFTIDNAYNINGITKHFTSSLEDHIICTDPSRNVFKYTNDKDEEIIDKDLEILLPQYLSTIKDKNNFFYKEVVEYFKKNNVSFNAQTDYNVFYQALNSIIEKSGNKISEKCKQYIIKECKRRFLEKNKNKNKKLTKDLSIDEIMTNIIQKGGSVNDFIITYYGEDYEIEEETEEECKKRREMEDMFIKKKKDCKK